MMEFKYETVQEMSPLAVDHSILPASPNYGPISQLVPELRGGCQVPGPVEITPGQVVSDPVNHPVHYTEHPSGIECIQITEHMGFCLGNAVKYIWRADLKGNAVEDLKKARWYLDREIAKREGQA